MSHHGSEPFDEMPEAFKKLLGEMKETSGFRGAIGAYPHGKLTAKDEGSIQFAIGEKEGKVVIDFGTPTAWIGMTPQQAMDLAASIMNRARIVARHNGETVHVTIGG
ncbi:MAG: hypothetical protein V4657_03795 [Pseudomonadota bacterium]